MEFASPEPLQRGVVVLDRRECGLQLDVAHKVNSTLTRHPHSQSRIEAQRTSIGTPAGDCGLTCSTFLPLQCARKIIAVHYPSQAHNGDRLEMRCVPLHPLYRLNLSRFSFSSFTFPAIKPDTTPPSPKRRRFRGSFAWWKSK